MDITVDNISEINSAPIPAPALSIIFHTIEENSNLASQHDAYQFQPNRQQVTSLMHRIRRISYDPRSAIYNPTLVPAEEKRLAGVSIQLFKSIKIHIQSCRLWQILYMPT